MSPATPHTFRRTSATHRIAHARLDPMTLLPDTQAVPHEAIASFLCQTRMEAERMRWALHNVQPGEREAPPALDALECDHLLDPAGTPAQRQELLRRLLTAALAQHSLDDRMRPLLHDLLDDEAQFTRLWEATCDWGPAVQQLLHDPAITTLTIRGTTVIGDGPHGRICLPEAYASVAEPLYRATFLAQASGLAWNCATPCVTVGLHSGMTIRLLREPWIGSAHAPDLLLVMRRRPPQPWTLHDLVAQGMLDHPAAALLAGLLHAGCSILISGQPETDTMMVCESLLTTVAPERAIVLLADHVNELRPHATALVSRVRRPDRDPVGVWHDLHPALAGSARYTPGMLVLNEVRGAEASIVLQHAEAGYPFLTTIQAASVEAALQRLARLVSIVMPHNSFAGKPHDALRVGSEAGQLIVHVAASARLRRSFVQHVWLLNGLDEAQCPQILPLVTSQVAAHTITWNCTAHIADRALVWTSPGSVTPPALAARLADLPEALWNAYCRDPLARPSGDSRLASGAEAEATPHLAPPIPDAGPSSVLATTEGKAIPPQGWLDAALARNRARRQAQAEEKHARDATPA